MASPDILDLARLLAPISEDSPNGSDIRRDPSPVSKYQTIKTARASARAAERKSIYDGDTSEADEYWRKIITLAPEILSNQSKDLEVAAWLLEAMLRRHGFSGLRDSLKLIQGLVENYWDGLYPMPDEDGMETRTAPIRGLSGVDDDGTLIAPIRNVPITQSPNQFNLWQYRQALEIPRSPDAPGRQAKIEKIGFSMEDIEKAVQESSSAFFVDQLDDVTQAIALCQTISEQLDQRCQPDDAPSVRNILTVLEECRGTINHIGKDRFPVVEVEVVTNITHEHTETDQVTVTTGTPGPASVAIINSRETALAKLQEVADYFRNAEPHSPISYIVEKAVRWGSLPLNELIAELITNPSALERFNEMTGLGPHTGATD